MKRLVVLAISLLVVLVVWTGVRARRERATRSEVEALLARERAAAHFERRDWGEARAELAPLLEARTPELEDLELAAAIEYMDRGERDPQALLERLRARDPENPALHYMLARTSLDAGAFEEAARHFRAVLAARPEDPSAKVGLAATLADLERTDEARALLAEVVAQGIERAGAWYVQAIYQQLRIAQRSGPPEEAQRWGDLFQQLAALGYRSASAEELDLGSLALGRAPRPSGIEGAEPGRMPRFVAEPAVLPELAGARELFALDLDGDGDTDLLSAGPQGVACALRGPQGFALETVLDGPVEHVRAFDLGNDDTLDLLACRGSELVLLEHQSAAELLLGDATAGRWAPSPLAFPRLDAPPSDLEWVDFDHDGDLDLLLVGPFGARLFRDDGAAPRTDERGAVLRGGFVEATREASLPAAALAWCCVEDFDGDQDVDFLLGGPDELHLMDSQRAGKFADRGSTPFGGARGMAREPLALDLDADARPDLFEPGAPSMLWRQRADGSFAAEPTDHALQGGAAPLALDLDLDGTLDLFWASASAAAEGVLGFGLAVETAGAIAGPGAPAAPLVLADLDRDLDPDLARVTPSGLEVLRCEGPVGHAARIELSGLKDNRRAVGAIVEARTRGLYRRVFWRGGSELLGCGPHAALDVVRITWPNGVVQTQLDVPARDQPFLDTESGRLEQPEGLVGSCPFLYTWNGSTFEFVSDVLGVTPLGLPMAPGVLVPPDHDEYVLVRGDQLVSRDGFLELQLTEELREVTYLDRVRLDVIDHPLDVEVHPNERFTFPPFPEAHVHTLTAPLAPARATGSDGRDWTRELAAVDGVHAIPFEPLAPQFLGLATPHWLELEFDPERVRAAAHLRLVCTGWFFWTDASVNVASARTPGLAFVPPLLQVPGPEGEWRDVGPPLGFPAGKSKTMVIELGDALDRERPQLRLFSTLRLYWDSIRLAVDADDAPLVTTALEPAGALLWSRGFSAPIETGRADQPERFAWDVLSEHARWNQHPGRYTRYGETLPLVQAIDDRFVILGSGDALHVRFDASLCPPLPAGWMRDYLVFLDGWAKDRDPNTLEALAVEPLPFHGMSAYPYGPEERFPDDEEHQAWRAEWNTRPASGWIPPLAPRREAEWAVELTRGR